MTARKRKARAVRAWALQFPQGPIVLNGWNGPLLFDTLVTAEGRFATMPPGFAHDAKPVEVMVVPRAEWLRLKRIERAAKKAAYDMSELDARVDLDTELADAHAALLEALK